MNIELSPSGGFLLTIPSTASEASYTISIPHSEAGLNILRRVLREQDRADDRRIGTLASPTQHMVEEWLRNDAQEKRRAFLDSVNFDEMEFNL